MAMLCDDIRYLTERALWETENLIKCVSDELWDKRYDGIPMWKYLYHTLYSMDRWYINPCDSFYRNPEFHTETLANLFAFLCNRKLLEQWREAMVRLPSLTFFIKRMLIRHSGLSTSCVYSCNRKSNMIK